MSVTTFQRVCLVAAAVVLWSSVADAGRPNTLTEEEQQAGFQLLFNGKDFDGWQQSGNWIIEEDGSIYRGQKGGSLTYSKQAIPDNFELRFEWKVGKGSNSGVYYRPGQNEYQILDNSEHPDGKNPRTSAASLYFCMAPSRDATKPVGEWNSGRVVCQGTVVQHWLNGEKVIGFDYTDPKWAFNVDMLKKRGGDVTARGAHLSLQDHNDPVWYRSIKLRELGENEKIDLTPATPAEIAPDVLAAEKAKLESILKRREKQAEQAKKNKKNKK